LELHALRAQRVYLPTCLRAFEKLRAYVPCEENQDQKLKIR